MKKKVQEEKARKKARSEEKMKELAEMKRRKELHEKEHEETLKILQGLDVSRCILVRGISYECEESTFRPLFEVFGPISQIFLVRHTNGKLAGYG